VKDAVSCGNEGIAGFCGAAEGVGITADALALDGIDRGGGGATLEIGSDGGVVHPAVAAASATTVAAVARIERLTSSGLPHPTRFGASSVRMTGREPSLSEAAIRGPLRKALATRVVAHAPPASGTPSAVLIPLFAKGDETYLWLVRRSASLRKHSGQVAFPGGKTDATDPSGLATALRESSEEIALPPSSVDVLGQLDDLVTGTGFTISPFVAWVAEPFTPRPNPEEVSRVFDAPLRAFFESARGIPPFHGHTVDGELVWGATGKIMRDLVGILRDIL